MVRDDSEQHPTLIAFFKLFLREFKVELGKFRVIFWRFFGYALPRPMGEAPIICQMKDLIKIHKCGKFHLYSIRGCQVINV